MPHRIGSTPQRTTRPIREFPIRPMYGVIIRDDLWRFRQGIGGTIGEIKQALQKGDAKAKPIFGDGRLQGKEYVFAKNSLKQLQEALVALGRVPSWSTPGAPGAAVTTPRDEGRSFPIRPMYGVIIRDDLQRFRNQITATMNEVKAAIAKGKPNQKAIPGNMVLEGKELQFAKAALKELTQALRALKNVGPFPIR